MKISKPLFKGRIDISNPKRYNGRTHIVKDNALTLCGVNYSQSETLGIAEEGNLADVTCKRCLKLYDS